MTMTMTPAQIFAALRNYTGTETWYRHPLFRSFLYTEGVQFVAEASGAYWLLDRIFGLQYELPALKLEGFQTWDLIVSDDKTAKLQCGDGNDNVLHTEKIEFTTCPLKKIRFYLTDSVLLLPSEY